LRLDRGIGALTSEPAIKLRQTCQKVGIVGERRAGLRIVHSSFISNFDRRAGWAETEQPVPVRSTAV